MLRLNKLPHNICTFSTKLVVVGLVFTLTPDNKGYVLKKFKNIKQCNAYLTNMTTKPHYRTCPIPQKNLKCVDLGEEL